MAKSTSKYQPETMPPSSLDAGALIQLIGDARAELAQYDALLSTLPNPGIITEPLLSEEATLSSMIEGTEVTFDEMLRQDGGIKNDEKRDDIQEITNYRDALLAGKEHLDRGRSISMYLVCGLHKILMDSVRGKNKSPGKVRVVQNYIGRPNARIEDASFVPPAPEQLPVGLDEWIKYTKSGKQETLVQVALMHAQFELLHPFLDGNGRVGRILIPLFLYQKRTINTPTFYVSAYLESHRSDYYRGLRGISERGDWSGWVKFFLQVVAAQCKTNNARIANIKKLYEMTQTRIQQATRSRFTSNMLNVIFTNPYCSVAFFVKGGIPLRTAHTLINKLEKSGILALSNPGAGRRAKVYSLQPLLDILVENSNRIQ